MSENTSLEKLLLKSISIYPSNEEESVRIYFGCISEQNAEKTFSVMITFTETDGAWHKLGNAKFTLEKAFGALNSEKPFVAELTKSSFSETLFEGNFVFE